jgi:hypothetical protein
MPGVIDHAGIGIDRIAPDTTTADFERAGLPSPHRWVQVPPRHQWLTWGRRINDGQPTIIQRQGAGDQYAWPMP